MSFGHEVIPATGSEAPVNKKERGAVINGEEVELSFEEQVLELERAAAVRLRHFNEAVDIKMAKLGIESFLNRVDGFLKRAKAIVEGTEHIRTDEVLAKNLLVKLSHVTVRLKKEYQGEFAHWVKEQIKDRKSWISRKIHEQEMRTALQGAARTMGSLAIGDALRREDLDSKVISRFELVENEITGFINEAAQEQELEAGFTEMIFHEFIIDSVWQAAAGEKKRKPTFLERVLGRRNPEPIEFYEALLPQMLDKAWSRKESAEGITEEQRLRSSIPEGRFRAANRLRKDDKREQFAETAKRRLQSLEFDTRDSGISKDEKIRDVPVDGWPDFQEAVRLSERQMPALIELLKPILGRAELVSGIRFSVAPKGRTIGEFIPAEQSITMYGASIEEAEMLQSFCHETGHAISPESNLPLKAATRFSIQLNESIKQSGFASAYSAQAQDIYYERLMAPINQAIKQAQEEAGGRKGNMGLAVRLSPDSERYRQLVGRVIRDSKQREEWAEMMSLTLASRLMRRVYPDKVQIVRDVLDQVGLSFDELADFFKQLAEQQETLKSAA